METLTDKLIQDGGYTGHVLTTKLPKELDNSLYTLIHFIGGMDFKDIIIFANNATEEEINRLSELVNKFPNNSIINELKHNTHRDQFLNVYNWIPLDQKWDLFSDEVADQINNDERTLGIIDDIFNRTNDINPYDRILHFFEKIHLDCLLDRLDNMSMAASVEA